MVVTTKLPKLAIDPAVFRILLELLPTRVSQEEKAWKWMNVLIVIGTWHHRRYFL